MDPGGSTNGRTAQRLRDKARAEKFGVAFKAALSVLRRDGGAGKANLEGLKRYATEKGLMLKHLQ